jgi:hypothetical protein
MHFLKFNLIFLLTFSSILCFSQQDSLISREKRSSNLSIAYNSSIIYPGARLGIEIPLVTNYITKLLISGKNREFIKDQFFTTNLSWYHHPQYNDNLYFTLGWTMRKTQSKGFFTEFSPEIGYSRTFLGATTYKVNNNGDITIEKLAGYNYALISLGGGIGYDFSVTESKPFLVYYKLNLLTMFPYNSTIYVRPAMELGLIYKPKHFLSMRVKSKKVNR